jgi:hypothetical protein
MARQTIYKLQTYIGVQFPSATQLVRIYAAYRARFSLDLREAFYHSNSSEHVQYKNYPGKYLFGRAHKMTTFRMLIGKV